MIRRFLPLAFLLPFVLVGCDTADDSGENEFPLTGERPAGFVYNAGSLSAGETYTESETESSRDIINDSRFEPSEVSSARIESGSVELSLDFPGGSENEVMVESATLTLSASGVGEQVVARGSDFSLAILTTNAQLRRQVLELVDADITEYLQQETFTGTLTLDIVGAGSGDYQFTVSFDVEASVNAGALTAAPVTF
jgi:hypothetical protein